MTIKIDIQIMRQEMRQELKLLLNLCIFTVFALTGVATQSQELPSTLAFELQKEGISEESVGIIVQSINSSTPLIKVNADIVFQPASTMKVLTTYAALELLGPSYTWKTGAYIDGKLENGILQGNLIIKGSGDPYFYQKELWLFIRQIQNAGLREIHGNIILDRNAFTSITHDAAAFDNEPLKPYNAGPDALLLNNKMVEVSFIPDESDNAVKVVFNPRMEGINIVPPVLSDMPCDDWKKEINVHFDDKLAYFEGSYSAMCGIKKWKIHPYQVSNTKYFESVFLQLWHESGGTFSGNFMNGKVPPNAILLAEWSSPELSQVVFDTNKYSNNVMARQLLLTLGKKINGAGSDTGSSIAVIKNWLSNKGIETNSLVIENGSGLSRIEKISALTMGKILNAAFSSSVMPELMSSFPIAGRDGTMSKQLRGNEIAGKAHIKTGAIANVRALAGYVLTKSGQRYLIVCMVNHPSAKQSRNMLNMLLVWTYENG